MIRAGRDLISSDVLQSFDEYFAVSKDKQRIIALAKKLERSKSPRAKKIAKQFLQRH
ncbi:MAG: hypothetical protein M1368_06400 [Thaumarchaeota archaeon]|nr:hypothetical protein [Nitrososphaerota archaeon]